MTDSVQPGGTDFGGAIWPAGAVPGAARCRALSRPTAARAARLLVFAGIAARRDPEIARGDHVRGFAMFFGAVDSGRRGRQVKISERLWQ